MTTTVTTTTLPETTKSTIKTTVTTNKSGILLLFLLFLLVNVVQSQNTNSVVNKEVVERLIRQWAPVVWLAPEEKFLPLGVDEFLRYVHAVDRGDSSHSSGGGPGQGPGTGPGPEDYDRPKRRNSMVMPLGEFSKKSYLVTNGDIEDLLEDDNSFIYGKNPNKHPVPIYAIVRMCNLVDDDEDEKRRRRNDNIFLHPKGRYIPISLNEIQGNSTIRRSSRRLFPIFKRAKRQATQTQTVVPPTPSVIVPQQTTPAVGDFIANLVDNVKFTAANEIQGELLDNSIDGGLLHQQQQKHPQQQNNDDDNNVNVPVPTFHVTYWMFYPYSQGKRMCTLDLGLFGSIPFPSVWGRCLGSRKDIGSHVGDWEHMTLFFRGGPGNFEPESMYVSAHDAGAYYNYNRLTGSFEFQRQETRKGILQRPNFPKTVTTYNNHPVLFAAKGSHGLWTAPGKHRFVKVARLYDINGFGTPWHTWKSVEIAYENLRSGRDLKPNWLYFKGKWGNPKSKCHPFRRIGLNFCEFSDGPTGIPLKEHHFNCDAI